MTQIVRIPLAVLFSLAALCILWPMEVIMGIILFPYKTLTLPKAMVSYDYHRWPRNAFDSVTAVWAWAFERPRPHHYPGIKNFLENMF